MRLLSFGAAALAATAALAPAAALSPLPLAGKVVVVTGASRGIGKGAAVALGSRGATVICTGRSATSDRSTSALGGDVASTAAAVSAAGGTGVPYACDAGDDDAVAALFAHVDAEYGRLDVLVNNAFQAAAKDEVRGNFWELPLDGWDAMHRVGLRSHYVAARAAAPLMIRTATAGASAPLIAGVSSFGGTSYTFNTAYGVGKAGVDRLARDMATELRPFGVASVSMYPGVVATEVMLDMVESGKWAETMPIDPSFFESPELTGLAVAALAALPADKLLPRSGKVQVVAEVCDEFGIVEPSDSRPAPPSIRSLKFVSNRSRSRAPTHTLLTRPPLWACSSSRTTASTSRTRWSAASLKWCPTCVSPSKLWRGSSLPRRGVRS